MFENLFTTYNAVEPPEGMQDIDFSNISTNTFEQIFHSNSLQPEVSSDTFNYPGVSNPFEDSLNIPEFNWDFETPSYEAPQISNSELKKLDIEDLLKQEGITSINGKNLRFGSKELRNTKKSTNHKVVDPDTGFASARDISIENGSDKDYDDFRKILLANPNVSQWMKLKGWGIINEITPTILSQTSGTGKHFHFGPDKWAKNTWQAWQDNPNSSITTSFRYYTANKNNNRTDDIIFAKKLNATYRKVLAEKGLDPDYSYILTAQDSNETGWGKKTHQSYNYGNITLPGGGYRKFSSMEDYCRYKVDFLQRDRYRFFSTFTPQSNIAVSMQTLANRGYAPGNYSYGNNVAGTYKTLLKYLS